MLAEMKHWKRTLALLKDKEKSLNPKELNTQEQIMNLLK